MSPFLLPWLLLPWTGDNPIVLGYPWLLRHKPHFNWSTNTVLEWGPTCHAAVFRVPQTWLQSPKNSCTPLEFPLCITTTRRSLVKHPHHCPYDCTTVLLLFTRGHIFYFSPPEWLAMDSYILEFLAAGSIWASASPADPGFFYWQERWWSSPMYSLQRPQ